MPIKSLELSNVGPFRPRTETGKLQGVASMMGQPDLRMEFDERANLFVGSNNSGKSSVLNALYALTRPLVDAPFGGLVSAVLALDGPSWTKAEDAWFTIERYYFGQVMSGSFAALGSYPGRDNIDPVSWNRAVDNDGFVGYRRSDSDIDMGAQFPGVEFVIENQENLYLLASAHSIAQIRDSDHEFDQQVLDATFDVLAGICEEFPIVISGATLDEKTELLRNKSLEEIFADSRDRGNITMLGDMGGYVTETVDGAHRITDLSYGTLSTLAWVSRLVLGMGRRYHGDSDWKNKPGIVIIDEIDAHLHPSWQRRIIPTLRHHFPSVQIFASTHSPMMVAGMEKGQVHLLKRDDAGRIVWSRNPQDVIGWTADEIYRTFMGIDDPTDRLTEARGNRLRELRNKVRRSDAEEDEMKMLRRHVNEDLLAKGRINAQRDRYAGLMEEFLRSRIADLSQDGV